MLMEIKFYFSVTEPTLPLTLPFAKIFILNSQQLLNNNYLKLVSTLFLILFLLKSYLLRFSENSPE